MSDKPFVKDIQDVMEYASPLLPQIRKYFMKWNDFQAKNSLINSIISTIIFEAMDWASMRNSDKVIFFDLIIKSLDLAAENDSGSKVHTVYKEKFNGSIH